MGFGTVPNERDMTMHLHDAELAYSAAILNERALRGTPDHAAAQVTRHAAFLLVTALIAERNARSARKVYRAFAQYANIGSAYRG